MNTNAIDTAVDTLGGATAVAKALGLRYHNVWCWRTGKYMPSPKTALQIERVTDGKVTRAMVRPDVFGKP